jgi:cytochrome c553
VKEDLNIVRLLKLIMPIVTRLVCWILPLMPAIGMAAVTEQAEFFEKRIRPLLIEHCTECHGLDKQKGSLRLDHRDGWQTGGDSGPSIIPGKFEESLLWKVVSYEDRDLKMPPKKKLPMAALEDLKTWIASGAHDPREEVPEATQNHSTPKADGSFWSFQPPMIQMPGPVKNKDWGHNEIDHFILSKLDAAGLAPSPEADAQTLVRRLSFDLTGLPPGQADITQPELNSSIKTQKTQVTDTVKLEALVDALLATPAFAERWASHFMDITRFAESSGGGRSLPFKDAWRFRDYLLEALRTDVPVDHMITQMIAGDLLPAKNAEERRQNLTATGFLALGPTNYEEQDKQMLRMDIVDEQLDTIGKSFMGMTIGCARCHDHKFDPVPTRDYYALAGIMRSTRTLKNYTDNVARWIDMPLPLEGAEEHAMQAKEKTVAKLTEEIAILKDELRDMGGAALRKKTTLSPEDLPGLVMDDSVAQKVGSWTHSTMYPPFIGGGYSHDTNEGKGEKTITFTPKLPVAGRYEVRLAFSAGPGRAPRIPATIFHADGEELVYFKQTTESLAGLQFVSLGSYRFEKTGQNFVMISNAGAEGFVTVDAIQFLPADAEMPDMPSPVVSNEEARIKVRLNDLTKQLRTLQKDGPVRLETMAVAEDEKPEDARIHVRGNIRNLGAPVPRGFIQAAIKGKVPTIPGDQSGRLQMAEWMTGRDHPLTSRVFVNRVWHWIFGAGIVRSTDNFGITGELPSHPELLDYLAVKFMEDGWSLKRLIKEMVMSRTYRMSSEGATDDADPDNRLLAHMNRKRLDAECIRDAMLIAAGSVDLRWAGPNIGDAKAVNANDSAAQNMEYSYPFNDSRRSVYTAAFRNVRHPLFEVFDFADINQPIAQRTTSTVATQALYLMNHPEVIELARATAQRVLEVDTDSMEKDIQQAYRLSLSREATETELKIATDYLEASVSGNSSEAERLDTWARLVQTLWATPEFRYIK